MDEKIMFHQAIEDFRAARRKAEVEKFLSPLLRKSANLLSYDEVRKNLRAIESSRRVLENIPLDQIVGSVNRYTDFSRSFLPRYESDEGRWARVRMGVDSMVGLPPIEAYKVGDVYFVLDGHHRVSVAREMGQETIQGYVAPVYTRVPLSPDDSPEDLILKAEYADFLAKTDLDTLCPNADLTITAPGQYEKLLEHISVHHYFMGEKRGSDVPYTEAVRDWYDRIYQPIARLIRERNLLRDFPGRTEADLYLWIMEYRAELSGNEIGWEVNPSRAASDLTERYSPALRRRLSRLFQSITNLLVPDPLERGPEPGAWRAERLAPHRGNRIFDDLLVTVWGEAGGWSAVQAAIEVARREEARLTGLHVVTDERQKSSKEVQSIQERFLTLCDNAGISGRLLVETGNTATHIIQRSTWVDLVIFRLYYPPPTQPLERLRSGARLLIQRSHSPILAVPDAPFKLDSALLAYGPGRKANEALYVAAYLAGRWNIPVTVLFSETANGVKARGRDGSPAPFEHVTHYLQSTGVNFRNVHEPGDAARNLARAVLLNAQENNNDLIIMGGYESGPLIETLFGSPVDYVPVLRAGIAHLQ
jgi:nucleotide-binding universal stress UspA family protein